MIPLITVLTACGGGKAKAIKISDGNYKMQSIEATMNGEQYTIAELLVEFDTPEFAGKMRDVLLIMTFDIVLKKSAEENSMTIDEAEEALILLYEFEYFLLSLIDPENLAEFELEGDELAEFLRTTELVLAVLEDVLLLDSLVGYERKLLLAEITWKYGNVLLEIEGEESLDIDEAVDEAIEKMKELLGLISTNYYNITVSGDELSAPVVYNDGNRGRITSKYTVDKQTGRVTFTNSQLQEEYNDGAELYYIDGELVWKDITNELDLVIVMTYAL